MKLSCLAALSLSAVAFSATAQNVNGPTDPQPSFDFIQAGYLNYDVSTIIGDMDGLALRASYQLNHAFFATFDYEDTSGSGSSGGFSANAEMSLLFANLGYQFYQQGSTSIYAAGGFTRREYEASTSFPDESTIGFVDDSNGFNVVIGVRQRFTENFEFDASVRHVDVSDDTDQIFNLHARYFFNPRFSIDARYTRIDSDMSGVGIGASFHF